MEQQHRTRRSVGSGALFAVLASALWMTSAPAANFQLLDDPIPNTWSNFSLSADGFTMAANYGGEIYRWTVGDGFAPIGPGSFLSSSIGISADGATLVASQPGPDDFVNPATWTEANGWVDLGHPIDGCVLDGNWGGGYAASGDGSVVVGLAWYCPGAQGFKWTEAEGMIGLGHPPTSSSRASDISADGSTIVGFYEHPTQGVRRPVRWVEGGAPDLFTGEEVAGEATAANSDGSQIVGQIAITVINAFSYTDVGGLVELGSISGLGSDQSIANDVSDNGLVVGWSGDPFWGLSEAFIWTGSGTMQSLRQYLVDGGASIPASVFLTNALSISADGTTVVGTWLDLDTYAQGAWMSRLDGVTPVFLAEFEVRQEHGAVEISFQIQTDAPAEQFELVATSESATWTVPVTATERGFAARDLSPNLATAGDVTYELYFLEGTDRQLVRREIVRLEAGPLATPRVTAQPTPFTAETRLGFALDHAQRVELSVFDLEGRRIAELSRGMLRAGEHEVSWNGTDRGGRRLPSGVYLVRLQTERGVVDRRVTLIR